MSNNRIKELENKINQSQIAYYNGSSIIDDDEYDALIYELSVLDPKNKLLAIIGAEPTNEWKKEKHLFPLGSLNKVNMPSDMSEWISHNLLDKRVLVAEKLDGLSIGCQYDNGKLTKSILRGGGLEGEDILINVLKMYGCVKNIPGFTGVLRGEIVLTKTNHKNYFETYANPRNAASGLCRRLDGEGCEHLTLMFYQVLGKEFDTEKDQFGWLEKSGCIVPNYKVCSSNEVNELWKQYQDTKRDLLDYEIDGLVVSCDDIAFQQSMGETNLKPKGKLAFKFANQFIKTTVKEITWAPGNSGRITPICWVEPVSLLGSTISKASIYNVAYIEKLGIDVGAEVLICKAGEIIPRIEKVVKSTGTITQIITNCPECNSILKMDGENLMCPNTQFCRAQIIGRIANYIKELNLLEWGSSLIEKLVDSGKVVTVADLYKLTVADLANLDRMGERSAQKAYDILWANTEIPLDILLGALSIQMIGGTTIRAIMDAGYYTIDKIVALTAADFEKVSGVGPTKAKFLADGLKSNKQVIAELLSNGIKIKEKVMGKLSGKSFCFTGTMINKRAVLEQMVVDEGGAVKSAGKSLHYLVIADPSSQTTKAQKARAFGTSLISEEDFLNMVK